MNRLDYGGKTREQEAYDSTVALGFALLVALVFVVGLVVALLVAR